MGLFSLPAQAVIITVGGVDYDVVYFTNGYNVPQPSINDNLATLTDPVSAPWWGVTPDGLGGTVDAEDFASEYLIQVGATEFDVSPGTDYLRFVFAGPVASDRYTSFGAWVPGIVVGPSNTFGSINYSNIVYAYTVPIPAVPEIDGNALAKALFILFALGAWLHTRRARAA